MRIAVFDKDSARNRLTSQALDAAGHECRPFGTRVELLAELRHGERHMVILDWQSAEGHGVEMIRTMRDLLPPQVPLLVFTNRAGEDDIRDALDAGANDYLIKPVRLGELRTRVNVLLRHAYPEDCLQEPLQFGPYTFDARLSRVTHVDRPINVTQKEFALALLFFKNMGRPLSRAYLQEAVWPGDAEVPSRTMDTHVSRVRTKLGLRPENGFRLATVYGYGYRLEQLPR